MSDQPVFAGVCPSVEIHMMRNFRLPLVIAALSAAVASQALILNFAGNGPSTPVNGMFTTTSLGAVQGDQFGFVKSVTTGSLNQVQLFDALGTSGLTLIYSTPTVIPYPGGGLFSAMATATGFGSFAGFTGSDIGITRNLNQSYTISIQGSVNPVPEPSAFAALGLGALGLLRRKRKA